MRDRDLADSPLASHRQLPSDHCDSLRDLLVEPFLTFTGPVPTTTELFRKRCAGLLDAGLSQARDAGAAEDSEPQVGKALLIRVMQLIAGDGDRRMALRATCYLRLMEVEGRSFEEIGKQFGVCRAAVQAVYRQIQARHPGLRSRGDKSDSSREACRRRRLGVRKPRVDWSTAGQWTNPLPPSQWNLLPLPL